MTQTYINDQHDRSVTAGSFSLFIDFSVLVFFVLFLQGCSLFGGEPLRSTEVVTPPEIRLEETPSSPTLTPGAPQETNTPGPAATLPSSLNEMLAATLLPSLTPNMFSFQGLDLIELQSGSGQPLLIAVITMGNRSYDPLRNHFVAILEENNQGWRELARLELACPDYVGEGSLAQVHVDSPDVWLAVSAGTGAHSGCFDLLHFADLQLSQVITHFNDSPLAGTVLDLDGDAIPEIQLNNTSNYIFCYACNVRLVNFIHYDWDGAISNYMPIELDGSPENVDGEAARLNGLAVTLANSELWKYAAHAIQLATRIDNEDQDLQKNALVIQNVAQARLEHAEDSAYPVLSQVFYGDYRAAVSLIEGYTPEAIFSPASPLVIGTVAEGFYDVLAALLIDFGNIAVSTIDEMTSQDLEMIGFTYKDLAATHFLIAWGMYLENPATAAGLEHLEIAQRLDPQESLYGDSLDYLVSLGLRP